MFNVVLCLMGPTASGKTALACELVQRLPVEIISVDSAMVYRGMDIGTAKPSLAELELAPHHLLDILDPNESFSAAQFCEQAKILMSAIKQRDKIPLLVGGTMMYFNALQQGLSDLPQAQEDLRSQLLQRAQQGGWAAMHAQLAAVDPQSAARIHPNDSQRIQRALEIFHTTGQPLSDFLSNKQPAQEQFVNLILFPQDRAYLHARIALRFKQMLHAGLIDETERLIQHWQLNSHHPALRCVGYRQVWDYLNDAYDEATLVDKGIAATRQLAKRQLTWLRSWPQGEYFACDQANPLVNIMAKIQEILDNEQPK